MKKRFSVEQIIGKLREEEGQSDDRYTEDGKKKGCHPRDFEHTVEPHGHSPWRPILRPSGATSPDECRDAFIHGHSPWPSAAGVKGHHEHAPQHDKLPLSKIDDSSGIVDDREPNRDQGIGAARGEPRDKELK